MNLLLDTHIGLWAVGCGLWAVEDNPRLSPAARALILDPAARLFVSVASLWAIAIKHALGKRGASAMAMSAAEAQDFFQASGYALAPITGAQMRMLDSLERHHNDPFARLSWSPRPGRSLIGSSPMTRGWRLMGRP